MSLKTIPIVLLATVLGLSACQESETDEASSEAESEMQSESMSGSASESAGEESES